jgi:phosphate/sulfate permease
MIIDAALVLHFGYTDIQLGIMYAIIPLLSAFAVFIYEKWQSKEKHLALLTRASFVSIFASTIITPILGFLSGGGSVIFRNLFYSVFNVASSDLINHKVDSKNRTTTLSTFSLLKKIPYVLFAFVIGKSLDSIGSVTVSFYLSLIFLGAFLLVLFFFPTSNRRAYAKT